MEDQNLISLSEISVIYELDHDFLYQVKEYEIVEIIENGNTLYISEYELPRFERVIRLYKDLNVNLEGIDIISNMIERMDMMIDEIQQLRNAIKILKHK